MSKIIIYILSGLAIISILAIVSLFVRLPAGIYHSISDFTDRITKPARWYFNAFLNGIKRKPKKGAPMKEQKMAEFGGIGRFVTVIVMAVISALIICYIVFTLDDLENFLLMDVLLNAPPMFIVSLILPITEGIDIFAIENMVEIVLTSAITFTFFHSNRELQWYIQIPYNIVFSVFFMLLPYIIPPVVYTLPAAVLFGVTDFLEFIVSITSPLIMGFFGLLLKIIIALFYIFAVIVSLYIIIAVCAVAIREFAASFTFSILPTAIMVAFVLVMDHFFGAMADLPAAIIIVVMIVALTVFINRSRDKADQTAISMGKLRRNANRKQRQNFRNDRIMRRAARRNKPVPQFELQHEKEYVPLFARIFIFIRAKIKEAYAKNA